jgi:glutathione S-transferase
MILYGSSVSPFVRKAIAFGVEKGLEFKIKSVGMRSQDPEFLAVSPFGKMPALRDGEYALADSSAIVAFFDALKPDPVLIPTDARSRGKVIWWDEFTDTIFLAAGLKVFFNRVASPKFLGKPGDEAVAHRAATEELPPLLDYLERSLPDSGWFVDDRLTFADISIASGFANLRYAGCPVQASSHPKLAAFVDKMYARPSFARSLEREAKIFAA